MFMDAGFAVRATVIIRPQCTLFVSPALCGVVYINMTRIRPCVLKTLDLAVKFVCLTYISALVWV
jgi:hypothetical protein